MRLSTLRVEAGADRDRGRRRRGAQAMMPINVEIFPCSGGMAEGFRRAGITFDFAFDKDPNACASYEANLGHRPVQIDVRDLLRMARGGWRPGRIRLLVADPPCTPWSRAGKRLGTEDERDCLRETAELISILLPDAYLIGSVPGLQDSTSWHVVQDVIGGLAAFGYCVADYAQLDAADYGVPQHRVRPFWYGHRGGPCLRWPARTHGSPEEAAVPTLPGIEPLRPWVTCREALSHLPLHDLGRPVRLKWNRMDRFMRTGDHRPTTPDEPAKTLTRNTHSDGTLLVPTIDRSSSKMNGSNVASRPDAPSMVVGLDSRMGGRMLVANEKHPVAELDAPAPTIGAKSRQQSGQLLHAPRDRHPTADLDAPAPTVRSDGGRAGRRESVLAIRPGQGSRIGNPEEPGATVTAKASRVGAGEAHVLDWPWTRPATTVHADERIAPPGHHDESFMSGANAVVLSERAAAILQGFPETWVFNGRSKKDRWSQIGQAMPPGLAAPVARAIADQLKAWGRW